MRVAAPAAITASHISEYRHKEAALAVYRYSQINRFNIRIAPTQVRSANYEDNSDHTAIYSALIWLKLHLARLWASVFNILEKNADFALQVRILVYI